LENIAEVEVTSEENEFPIEAALLPGERRGWRAAAPGPQTVRLRFDQPQTINRIALQFEERQTTRTQEFVLRYSSGPGAALQDIVRQQWNFSPPDTISEVEDYRVQLSNVTMLELTITPDISRGPARASLRSLRLG
jgi:hypothetical protein